jgi:Zn-dependent protease with chaperone function
MTVSLRRFFRAALILVFVGTGALVAPVRSALAASDLEKEIQMGEEVSKAVEEQMRRIADPVAEAHLAMLLSRFTPLLNRHLDYQVRILDEKSPNAFAIPGGRVYVTKGMLDFVRGDGELAAVLAHELTHADRRHVMIQVARNEKLSLLALAVVIASRGSGAALVMANALAVAVSSSYSRDLEREADRGGVALMVSAGFDPVASLTLMERLKLERIRHPWVDPGIYQDHPDEDERIDYTAQALKDRRIPIRRKGPLGLLRVRVEPRSGDLVLLLDATPVCSLPEGAENRACLEGFARRLDAKLQLETPPYDLRVIDVPPPSALCLRGERLLEARPGVDPEEVRRALAAGLEAARRKHPLTDWYR